jgi:hypothetical protein
MDRDPSHLDLGSSSSSDEARMDSIETEPLFVEVSLAELGLFETEDLSSAREAILAGLKSSMKDDAPSLITAWNEYATIVETIVEQIPSSVETRGTYIKLQIAALLHRARLFRDAGRSRRYLQELDTASFYAYNERLDDVHELIEKEIEVHCRDEND